MPPIVLHLWRDGRADDCTGLENQRPERVPGFESLSFRMVKNGVCLTCGYMVLNSEDKCSRCGTARKRGRVDYGADLESL